MIHINHLWFSYTGTPPYILNDINLELKEGEYLSVIGENGCGKSTLMRILLGFLKPNKGELMIETKRIGYVPQRNDFNHANFPITVFEVMNSYSKLLKLKDKKLIMKSLELTGMDKFKHSLIGNLSGGQIQKIMISRALMGNPNLLILDEPSTGVDLESQKEIYGLLKEMNVNQNITILAVEHNLDAVLANSTKIFHLQNGHGHLCNPDQYKTEFFQRKNNE